MEAVSTSSSQEIKTNITQTEQKRTQTTYHLLESLVKIVDATIVL